MLISEYREHYRVRLLTCLAGVLLLCIALVELWPTERERDPGIETTSEEEIVPIETVTQTNQEAAPPPPPSTVAPSVRIPDAVLLAKEPLDLEITRETSATTDGSGFSMTGTGQDSAGTGISDESPQPIHFAEPAYPRAAWQQRIGAQIVVKVHVNSEGRAENSRIIDRYLLDYETPRRSVSAACCSRKIIANELAKTSVRSAVSHLGYGFEEAALGAAWKWRFKPPTRDGKALASYAILTFTFGR